ncbi:type IV secretory system conjugative DNA transfer family protein [Clostridium perfringens]|uniref:VirD4-like conjugal transfer protein, CD1115 family n=1 Tax=Clostridium perfringens TaxID=1502 RepID=UPI0013E2F725|nr:type IV secretory system conjugative DNA transfer family protein [Clostridium perfringens]NGT68292.1 type IV secretory system conjugative DNA transfer family protein [Clostridium perfringens]
MRIDIDKEFKSLKKKYNKYKGKYKDKIEELNDNDKSVQKLKIAKLLADDITLKWLGILMFAITTVVVTILSNFLSFGIASVINNEKHYFFQYLVPRLFRYFWLYLITYTIVGFIYFKMRFTIKASFGEIEKGQKGDMRLATKKEIREQYISVPEKDKFFKGKGGVPVSREGDVIYIDSSDIHVVLIGTSRSGKGEGVILIYIDILSRAEEKASLIINDVKGELCGLSKDVLEKRGYEVKVLNLMEMDNSHGYNPLEIIKEAYQEGDFGEAQLRCRTFTHSIYYDKNVTDKTWDEASMDVASALILAICEKSLKTNEEKKKLSEDELRYWENEEKKFNLYSVARMLSELGSDETTVGTALDLYFDSLPNTSIAKLQYSTIKFTKSRTRSSLLFSASRKLQIYTYEKIARFTAENDINLQEIGFFKRAEKKVKIKILDKVYEGDSEEYLKSVLSQKSNIDDFEKTKDKVELHNVKDEIVIYKNQFISDEMFLENVLASNLKNEDISDKIEVNTTRIYWGDAGTYEMYYEVVDNKNSKPTAVFLTIPDSDKSNHSLGTIFISQLYRVLSKKLEQKENGRCDRDIKCILDEFGSMVPIEDLPSKLSVCLGKGISFFMVIQSYQQLKDSYGESYQAILDNCGMTIYLKTTNSKTANEISEQIGDKTMIINSRNGSVLELNKQITESLDKERVIKYDDLMALEIGENVVIRPMHRKDLKGNPIKPYPIYNTEKTKMKFRYEYLQDTFTGSPSMRNILVKNTHKDIILENIKADFSEEIPEIIAVKMDEMIEKQILNEIRYEEAKKRLQGIRSDKEKSKKEKITDEAREEIRKKYEMLFNNEILSQITSKKELKEIKEYLELIGYSSEYENIKNIVMKGSD